MQSPPVFSLKDWLVFLATSEWGHCLSFCRGPQPGLLLDASLTWSDHSVFCSSRDFARFSPNFLKLSAFPQETTVTSVFLSSTSYYCWHSWPFIYNIKSRPSL